MSLSQIMSECTGLRGSVSTVFDPTLSPLPESHGGPFERGAVRPPALPAGPPAHRLGLRGLPLPPRLPAHLPRGPTAVPHQLVSWHSGIGSAHRVSSQWS